MKKAILPAIVAIAFVLLFWTSVPLLWLPKYNEINFTKLTQDVDRLASACNTNAGIINVALTEHNAPYIFSLESHDVVNGIVEFDCNAGVRLKLWADWWTASAGLYVLRGNSQVADELNDEATEDQYALPEAVAPLATRLESRVYSWYDAG